MAVPKYLTGAVSTLDAVNDILGRAVIEVRKSAFDFDSTDKKSLSWTPVQFWAVLRQLAVSDSVSKLRARSILQPYFIS